MLLVGKVTGGVKNGVFDVAILSHVTGDEFKNTRLFDVRIFAVDKDFFKENSMIVVTIVLIVSRNMHH